MVTVPEEQGRQQGGKRRSARMSGIRNMLRALKKGAVAVGASSAPIVASEQHHHHHHHHQSACSAPFTRDFPVYDIAQHRVICW